MTFWKIIFHGKDYLYQWWFLWFGFKNTPTNFKGSWIRCWKFSISPNITLMRSFFSIEHLAITCIIYRRCLEDKLRIIILSFTRTNVVFFCIQVECLSHMIYLCGLGFKRPKLRPFHKFPNQHMSTNYKPSLACVIIIKDSSKGFVTLLNLFNYYIFASRWNFGRI
jgi:hypothetical protein